MDVRMPDGTIIRNVPDGTTRAQLQAKLDARDKRAVLEASIPKPDPTGTTPLERGFEGMGSGFARVGRALGLGDTTKEEAAALDAPLLGTTAGTVGNIAGLTASLVPTAFIPGANTMLGAAAIGAGAGALTTEGGAADRAKGALWGGLGAPAGLALGRGTAALLGAVKGLYQPFTQRGQGQLAANLIREFAGDDAALAAARANVQGAGPVLPGTQPLTAELADNAGLAQLDRTLRANPQLTTRFTDRLGENREAVVGAVEGIAGTDAQMAAAEAARVAASGPLYAASRTQNILPDAEFMALAQRPIMQQAIERAVSLGQNSGRQQAPGEFFHAVKQGLDDMLSTGPQRGIGAGEANAVRDARAQFVDWLGRQSPEYDAGRVAYAAASRPINQMQTGQALRDRLVPALSDAGADRLTPQKFAQALRDGDRTVAQATGRPNLGFDDVMDPAQRQTLQQAAEALGRRARADELGRIPGSPTAQNIVSQNLARQILGPLGLPENFIEGQLMRNLLRLPQLAFGRAGGPGAEQNVLARAADAMLDPDEFVRLSQIARPPPLPGNRLAYIPAAGQGIQQGTRMALEFDASDPRGTMQLVPVPLN